MLEDSESQEFIQRLVRKAYLCFTVSGASVGRLEVEGMESFESLFIHIWWLMMAVGWEPLYLGFSIQSLHTG